jgi:thymidylate synthase ThyX
MSQHLKRVKEYSSLEKNEIFGNILKNIQSYQSVPRAFELADFTFQLSISSCCFGQLKRHRMSTIIKSNYQPQAGYVIPPLLRKIKAEKEIQFLMQRVEKMFYKLEEEKKGLGSYILTNAHRVNVIFHVNLRELYHFSRLRSDKHAQWEIREISLQIDSLLRNLFPNAAQLLMGKDSFNR